MQEFIIRIGTFLIVIGVGIFILFLASDYANAANFDYLCFAVVAITVGIMLRRQKAPPPPSGRFALWRKMRERPEKTKEEKK
jgi:hypothetical protein